MGQFIDLTGRTYGWLTVVERAGYDERGHIMWLCRCKCGNYTTVPGDHLRSGHTKSCGCYMKERSRECNIKHGGRYTRLYKTWAGVIQRCTNPNHKSYVYYGGNGIKICPEWLNSFEAFRDWALANGYADDLTIERINPNKGYYPENCCWVDRKAQNNNKGDNRILTIEDKTRTLAQHIEDPEINVLGLDYNLVYDRIFGLKWTSEEAFSTPPGGKTPVYTIKGKTQTLAQHVADPEINIYNLEYDTAKTRRLRGLALDKIFSTPPRERNLEYTIKGKTQSLTQHVKDPEINIYDLKKKTVCHRFYELEWTLEEAFFIPLGGKRNSQEGE